MLRDIHNLRNQLVGRSAGLVRDMAWVRDALAELRDKDPNYVGQTGAQIDAHLQRAGRSLRQVAVLVAQIEAGEIGAGGVADEVVADPL